MEPVYRQVDMEELKDLFELVEHARHTKVRFREDINAMREEAEEIRQVYLANVSVKLKALIGE